MTEPPQDAYHRAGGEPADDCAAAVNRLDRFLEPATLKRLRSTVLFVVGLGGVVYELIAEGTDRPTLIVLLAAMMGLPTFLAKDEKRRPPADDPPPSNGGTA